jgi:hypothetical protein
MMGIRQLLFQLIAFNSFATIPFVKALAFQYWQELKTKNTKINIASMSGV